MAPIWSLPSELELFPDWFVATVCTGIESSCISDFHLNAETTFFSKHFTVSFLYLFLGKNLIHFREGLTIFVEILFSVFSLSPFLRKSPKCSN